MWCWPWQHRGPQASSLPPCEQPEMGGLGSCLGERAGGSQKGRMMWEGPEERREGSEGERVGLWSLPFDGHLGPSGPGHTPPRAKAVSAYPAVPSENRRARGAQYPPEIGLGPQPTRPRQDRWRRGQSQTVRPCLR